MANHEYKRYILWRTENYVKQSLTSLANQILAALPKGVTGFQYGKTPYILIEDDLKYIPQLEHFIFIIETWNKVAPALRRWLNQANQPADLVGWFPSEIWKPEGLENTMEASRIKEITDSEEYGLLIALVYRQVLIPS